MIRSLATLFVLCISIAVSAQVEVPKTLVPRLSISLFASEPDVVTPTGIAVDEKGRVFCIESHTHFRPKNYSGPPKDRIRIYEDTTGDGKADKITTYFEGTTATMNLAFAPDGSLYVATRDRIFRLVDKDADDRPDSNELIIDLQTKGNYPHNGLSGLAFQAGRVYFGFGENLGVNYQIVGSDGKKLAGGGEGGNIFVCDLDGSNLTRVATGFWNPFGLAFDRSGNLFAIDNDPDWRPPCRLLHIVQGGDYGYRFSHGRRGTHPFTAWFGELPGTLGLVSGTGEAPSGMIRYDSLAPNSTTSTMLSTSWGLHSIEQFDLQPSGATYAAVPQTIVKGGKDFRPVAMAVAPDGTIFISDWCKRSYELHGHGRIWKLKCEGSNRPPPLKSMDRFPFASRNVAERQIAANTLTAEQLDSPRAIQAALSPHEKAELIRKSGGQISRTLLLDFLKAPDAFMRQAARYAMSESIDAETLAGIKLPQNPVQRAELALVMRQFSSDPRVLARLPELLADHDPEVRFVAVRWIGEERLATFADQLQKELRSRPMTGRLFESYLAALDMLNENRKGAEFEKAEAKILAELLGDQKTEPGTLVIALRKLQSVSLRDSFKHDHPKLNLNLLKKLLGHQSPVVVREVIRTIRDLDSQESAELLLEIVRDRDRYGESTKEAIVGLDHSIREHRQMLVLLAGQFSRYSAVARQSLVGAELTAEDVRYLKENGMTVASLTRRERPVVKLNSVKSWISKASPDRGRLIFFNERFGQCAKCHQVDGRGAMIGPDLSNLSNMSYERLFESIVSPHDEIAPRHTPWIIQTYDGLTLTGVLVAERGDVQTYADTSGKLFRVRFDEIERKKSATQSIMPEGLLSRMTDQEIADLLKFLKQK